MGKFVLWMISTTVVLAAWTGLVFVGTQGGWLKDTIAPAGDSAAFKQAIRDKIDSGNKGNLGYALIEKGQVVDQYFVSKGTPVNQDTVFQVASISKWLTAWGVMALVEAGKIDLDKPVSTYLTRWQLPQSEFDNNGVTVRRLLSHTAGLIDGLGFAGFEPGDKVQTLEQSLQNPNASSPDGDRRIRVGIEPGSAWAYSGGGYTILQLLVEEVSGVSFRDYMKSKILRPLGMKNSTYVVDSTTSNVAPSYHSDGTIAVRQNRINFAASSFYTSVADMSRFVQANYVGADGQLVGKGILSEKTLSKMRTPHASMFGMDIWGMGPVLWAPAKEGGFVIGGGGARRKPAINADVRVNPLTGDGIVVLQTGDLALASKITGQWTFLKTGKLDLVMLKADAKPMLKIILGGYLLIILLALVLG
jgi:CubicO group peptidase (beta-lactamase class C family)